MADLVDQVNTNNATLSARCSASRFSEMEEQCQEASFVDDKVCISETGITIDNAEQDSIWYTKIKQHEEPTCLNNIKTELESFQVNAIKNDNVKIEGELSVDNIKIEFDEGLLYCEYCEAYYRDYCLECGMLASILNNNALNNIHSGAREDIPNDLLEVRDCFGHTGIYALRIIPAGVTFGPFTGLSATESPWKMKGDKFVLDQNKWKYLNWMQYVNLTRNTCDQNLHVFQFEDNIYYQSTRQIQAGEELLVYFGDKYGNNPNKTVKVNFVTTTKDISKDIFACTFCCLGFSSKSHLVKHKTICVQDTAGKFSVEELTQCPFCKIHLDPKEYLENHMSFCCERNARKKILPTPSTKEGTTALNGRKRCFRQIYKCKQCNYRTKYQSNLKKHYKQHHEVKMYKCGNCNTRFKTKESLRLHMENTHAVGGKDNQEHDTTNYRNTLIKVEQSSSIDKNKIFKCSLCVFQTKNEQFLRRHKNTEHLKKFDYKCDSCKYGTDTKSHLKVHIKRKHLKELKYKCDSCDYGTNNKTDLKRHVRSKHLKEFDYKCDSCEYSTNFKSNLKAHIKTKHLKEFSYKCDSCAYETNNESSLKYHVKTKHLKEFDYKCELCEYGTNSKNNLEGHIKTKHLKEFSYKCDSCEFGANNKNHLNYHVKTKHLKEFDHKCDSCEYGTNIKTDLKNHIKSKHLKQFDFKCDSCEYGTNRKDRFESHMKAKHLKNWIIKLKNVNLEQISN